MKCVLISLCVIVIGCSAKSLPSFIEKCKRDYPEVNNCLIKRITDIKPYLLKGIPEMKVPGIEPLRIPKVQINTGNDTSSGFSASLSDIVIDGAMEFEIKKVDFNLKKEKFFLQVYIPKLRIRSKYNFNGKILVLQLNSNGPADVNITKIESSASGTIKEVTRNGRQYIELGNEKPVIAYAKPSLYFGDLFKGNEELTEHTNKVINDNIEEIGKELKPLVDETIHAFVNGIIRRVFDEYSMDELFA